MSNLADEVDVKTEQRMSNVNLRTQEVEEKIESLSPLLRKLQHNLEHADQMLSRDLLQGLEVRMSTSISTRTQLIVRPQKSHYQINSGVKSAEYLEKMLQAMLQSAPDSAHIHEHSQHSTHPARFVDDFLGCVVVLQTRQGQPQLHVLQL